MEKEMLFEPENPAHPTDEPLAGAAVASAPAHSVPVITDPALRAENIKSFVRRSTESMAEIRSMWQQYLTSHDPRVMISDLDQLRQRVHALTGSAAAVGFQQMANLSSAFAGLLKELCDRPANINPSTLRTVGLTMDFQAYLIGWAGKDWPAQVSSPRVLVVDDEIIARTAAESALRLVNVRPTTAESAAQALTLLEANLYDLILLDVDMPGMTGFELCSALRKLPAHKSTPVIFVTGLTSFENRAKSAVSGGNDLIGKPYLMVELTVKAVAYLLRRQLQPPRVEKLLK